MLREKTQRFKEVIRMSLKGLKENILKIVTHQLDKGISFET